MIKYRFVAWVILGFLVGLNGFSQSKGSTQQKTSAQCDKQQAAYENAQGECADFYARLKYLKQQIAAEERQRADLIEQCQQQKNPSACKQLADLSAGRISVLQQEYANLAAAGCRQSAASPQQIASTCAADGSIPTSNQNKTAPTSPGKTPANNTSNGSQPSPPRQNPSADRSFHTPPSRMPQPPQATSGGASGGNNFGRQSGFGGPSGGGQVSPPPSASSTGTEKPK